MREKIGRFLAVICLVRANSNVDVELFLNTTNPIFADNELVEIDVRLGDKVDIVCPRVQYYHDIKDFPEPLYLNLFRVDFRGFKTCSTTLDSKRLIRCNVPEYPKKYTTIIQRFNPLPYGLEFEPNHSYYFIVPTRGQESTDVEQGEGGVCETHNMRFIINVVPDTTTEPTIEVTTQFEVLDETTAEIEAQPSVALLPSASQPNQGFVMNMQMWLVALFAGFVVILIILIGFCIAYCCIKSANKKKYDYSSPTVAFDQCTTIRRDGEEHLVYSRRLDTNQQNGTYRVCSTPGYHSDQSFLPFLPGNQSTLVAEPLLPQHHGTFNFNQNFQRMVSSQLMQNGYLASKEMNSTTQMETDLSDLNSYSSKQNSPLASSNEDSLPKCGEIKITPDGHHTVQV